MYILDYFFICFFLIRINDKYANIPNDIEDKAIGIQGDINEVIKGVSEI